MSTVEVAVLVVPCVPSLKKFSAAAQPIGRGVVASRRNAGSTDIKHVQPAGLVLRSADLDSGPQAVAETDQQRLHRQRLQLADGVARCVTELDCASRHAAFGLRASRQLRQRYRGEQGCRKHAFYRVNPHVSSPSID